MKPAWKELKYNRKKYILVESIVILMMFMALFLSGLVKGHGRAVSSGIENMNADAFVLRDNSEKLITVSELNAEQSRKTEDEYGKKATPLDIQRMYRKKTRMMKRLMLPILGLIRMEVRNRNKAAVMVTHDERILDLVDRVYRMEDGKLNA